MFLKNTDPLTDFLISIIFTRATCGRPSLGLPFCQSIFLSIYLSCRIWENYPEVLAYSFDENKADKAFLKSKLQKAFEPSFVETEKSFKHCFQVFLKMSSYELLAPTVKVYTN